MAVVLCMSLEEEEEDREICWMSSAQALGSSSSPHDGGGGQQSTSAAPASMATRQATSMYNLTLSEVQDHLGEPLLSMNLDDLLRNVLPLPLEAGGGGDQPTTTEAVVEEEEEDDDHHHQKKKKKTVDAEAFQSGSAVASSSSGYCGGMQRQQGSVTLLSSTVLSKKTVDEVWKDIQKGQPPPPQQQQQQPPGRPDADGVAGERQPTLGEMTLEDFLMKAGVVAEGWDIGNQKADTGGDVGELVAPIAIGEGGMLPPPPHWLQQQRRFPHASLQQQQLRPVVVGGNYGLTPHHPMPLPLQAVASGATAAVVLDVGYSDQMGSISSPIRGTLSDSPAATARKRTASSAMVHGGDVVVEKTVERRQKRMIKNRESAARSRARKQAYTNELENKVSRLEEENELLKKQQELDRILYSTPIPEPKFRLRRTSSSPL